MNWLRENWFWIVVGILFFWLHAQMHGGHGHGGHGGRGARSGGCGESRRHDSDDGRANEEDPRPEVGEREARHAAR